jgi:hypothetical protein
LSREISRRLLDPHHQDLISFNLRQTSSLRLLAGLRSISNAD